MAVWYPSRVGSGPGIPGGAPPNSSVQCEASRGHDDWASAKGAPSTPPSGRATATLSMGNVFEDLGLPGFEELAAKADLARAVRRLLEAERLSQRDAAPLVGVAQSDLSNLYRGRLDGFSIERLSRMLVALGRDMRTVVQPKPLARNVATVRTRVRGARKSG